MSKKQDLQKIDEQITNLSDMYGNYDVANIDDVEKLEEHKSLETNLFISIKQFRHNHGDNYFNGTSTQKRWLELEELKRKSIREKDNRQENREDESLHLATKANVIAYYAMLLSAVAVIIAVGVAWVSVGEILLKMISPYL